LESPRLPDVGTGAKPDGGIDDKGGGGGVLPAGSCVWAGGGGGVDHGDSCGSETLSRKRPGSAGSVASALPGSFSIYVCVGKEDSAEIGAPQFGQKVASGGSILPHEGQFIQIISRSSDL